MARIKDHAEVGAKRSWRGVVPPRKRKRGREVEEKDGGDGAGELVKKLES